VELLNSPHQPYVALLNQIEEGKTSPHELSSNRDHESQVRFGQLLLCKSQVLSRDSSPDAVQSQLVARGQPFGERSLDRLIQTEVRSARLGGGARLFGRNRAAVADVRSQTTGPLNDVGEPSLGRRAERDFADRPPDRDSESSRR